MKALTIALLAIPMVAFAQGDGKPVSIGGFENQGSVTTGYRFTDVNGYRPKFNELFDLNDGFRLLDFSLFGTAQDGANRFADNYSLTASGLGGDPFASTQFTVRKNHLYDLRVNFRQSHYYWNRNDAAALPNGLSGLTSNHDWATVRKLGSVNLLIHATDKALAEHGAKVGETERRGIENAMADLKEAVKGDDVEAIRAKTNALAQASMKLGEAMYAQAQGQNPGQPPGDGGAAGGGPGTGAKEDVVDAEFTEVDDDKKNKKSA